MNIGLNIKGYTIKDKAYIGENSVFYQMQDDDKNQAVLKLTNYEKKNFLEFNSLYESEVIMKMSKYEGFPKLIDCGNFDVYSYSLMSQLGISLESLFQMCKNKFTLKTTLLLFDQMLERIESLHDEGLLHGNLSPEHFVLGINNQRNLLYLISFGSVQVLRNNYKNDPEKVSLEFSFQSKNSLLGKPIYQKDDLESLIYIVIYFLKGELSWSKVFNQTLKNKNDCDQEDIAEIIKKQVEMKTLIPVNQICESLPVEFSEVLQFCRESKDNEIIDYDQIRKKFKKLYFKNFEKWDQIYDWDYLDNDLLVK